MGRPASDVAATPPSGPELFGAEELLAALAPVLMPLVQLLIEQSVDYSQFATWLKGPFLETARRVLERREQKITDSAISLLSGVHRKDVRTWREQDGEPPAPPSVSLASQLFHAWKDEPAFCDKHGQPRPLPRLGVGATFETLARIVSSDLHPFTLLNELIRLGVARLDMVNGEECVCLNTAAYTPAHGSLELLQLFSGNLAAHAGTATANLLGAQPPSLERSVFAQGLSAESAARLEELARSLWEQAQAQWVTVARRLYENDKNGDHAHGMRFGAYYHKTGEES